MNSKIYLLTYFNDRNNGRETSQIKSVFVHVAWLVISKGDFLKIMYYDGEKGSLSKLTHL